MNTFPDTAAFAQTVPLNDDTFPQEQKQQIMWHCMKSWNIPYHIRDHLDSYYMLHWDTRHFLKNAQLEFIDHQGIPYSIAYYAVLPPGIIRYEQILLSFRRISGMTKGIVLIRPKLGTEIISSNNRGPHN